MISFSLLEQMTQDELRGFSESMKIPKNREAFKNKLREAMKYNGDTVENMAVMTIKNIVKLKIKSEQSIAESINKSK